jgi:hypothetical protein
LERIYAILRNIHTVIHHLIKQDVIAKNSKDT